MTKPSESQKNYIRTVRRRRRTVQFMRLFLFLFFVVFNRLFKPEFSPKLDSVSKSVYRPSLFIFAKLPIVQ